MRHSDVGNVILSRESIKAKEVANESQEEMMGSAKSGAKVMCGNEY